MFDWCVVAMVQNTTEPSESTKNFTSRSVAILFDFKYFEPCTTVDDCSDHVQRVCGASPVQSQTSV